MNHSFIQLFNSYQTAITRKKKYILVNYTRQNVLFAEFLLKNRFIFGFETNSARKKKVLVLFLKYDQRKTSAIADFSLTSKTCTPKRKTKESVRFEHSNFIVDLAQKQCVRLLARIR
jgi:ribosomal protein S8